MVKKHAKSPIRTFQIILILCGLIQQHLTINYIKKAFVTCSINIVLKV